jgi:hypothetical protein
MLIDLEWTKQYAHLRERAEWIKEFNTQDGHLIVTYEYPPNVDVGRNESRIYKRCVAERIHKGVYWANNLWNDIEAYTHWSVEHPFTGTKALFDLIEKAPTKEEMRKLREALLRMKGNYGNADSFKQIFRYGRLFIRSPNPYVLEVRSIDVSGPDGDRYLDKNGSYIGKKKPFDLKEVVFFNFHKLIQKDI